MSRGYGWDVVDERRSRGPPEDGRNLSGSRDRRSLVMSELDTPSSWLGVSSFPEEGRNSVNIAAVSVGDDVDLHERRGVIHTAFRHVMNCKVNGSLVSIVTPAIGSGPNNIVVDSAALASLTGRKGCICDFSVIDVGNARVFDSRPVLDERDSSEFLTNLHFLEQIVMDEASPLSCAFVLDERRAGFFRTPVETNVRDYLRNSYARFIDGSLEEVNTLKGVGFGLTPQGDDLTCGTLIAIYVYGLMKRLPTEGLRHEIYNRARTSNEISNTFLLYASLGRVYEKFKDLLDALAHDRTRIHDAASRFLGIGETSGADVSTGFIVSMKKFYKGGLPWLQKE
jgi:hypothetical protein